MSGLYHTHNIAKGMIWNVGIIITKQAITCTGYPYFLSHLLSVLPWQHEYEQAQVAYFHLSKNKSSTRQT